MKYCKRCLYPENHPLNLTFDEYGVCSGCRIHEEKDTLNWKDRTKKLENILNKFRNTSGNSYDCIIPVSGARDSYFILHTIKNVMKMNPLLVSYNKHYNTNRGIRNLAYLKTIFNCDTIQMVVDPAKIKRITRRTLEKMGSMYWHILAGQTVFPVQAATRLKIPLIIWGAHQGIDQVGMFSHTDEVEMTRKYRKEHDLMGFEAEDLLESGNTECEFDLIPFFYPHDKDIEKVGVRGIYLNNYIRWDSKKQHELMIKLYGYESAKQQRTFDTYNDVDCIHYSGIHDYIKFLKYGYGKVTDHACREIRLKRLTREEGIELVSKYQDIIPEDLIHILNFLEIGEKEFFSYIDLFRDNSIWDGSQYQGWKLKDSIINHINDDGVDSVRLKKSEECKFEITASKQPDSKEDEYVLLARGFVDKYKVKNLTTMQ